MKRIILLLLGIPFALPAMEAAQIVHTKNDFDVKQLAQEVAYSKVPKYEKIISDFIDKGPFPEKLDGHQFSFITKLAVKPHYNTALKDFLENGWLNPNSEYKSEGEHSYGLLNQMVDHYSNDQNLNTIELFLQFGADPNIPASSSRESLVTPLNITLKQNQYPELVELLLKYGADPNRRHSKQVLRLNKAKETELHQYPIQLLPLIQEVADYIVRADRLAYEGSKGSKVSAHKADPLQEERIQQIGLLFEYGADPDARDDEEYNAFKLGDKLSMDGEMRHVSTNFIEACGVFKETHEIEPFGSARELAQRYSHETQEILSLFDTVKKKPSPIACIAMQIDEDQARKKSKNDFDSRKLAQAVAESNAAKYEKTISDFLALGPLGKKCTKDQFMQALKLAVSSKYCSFIKILLERNWLNPNFEYVLDDWSFRLLPDIANSSFKALPYNTIELLLKFGADSNVACNLWFGSKKNKKSALAIAVSKHDSRLAELLLKNKADPNKNYDVSNKKIVLPLISLVQRHATRKGQDSLSLIKLFLEYGADPDKKNNFPITVKEVTSEGNSLDKEFFTARELALHYKQREDQSSADKNPQELVQATKYEGILELFDTVKKKY